MSLGSLQSLAEVVAALPALPDTNTAEQSWLPIEVLSRWWARGPGVMLWTACWSGWRGAGCDRRTADAGRAAVERSRSRR